MSWVKTSEERPAVAQPVCGLWGIQVQRAKYEDNALWYVWNEERQRWEMVDGRPDYWCLLPGSEPPEAEGVGCTFGEMRTAWATFQQLVEKRPFCMEWDAVGVSSDIVEAVLGPVAEAADEGLCPVCGKSDWAPTWLGNRYEYCRECGIIRVKKGCR